MDEFTNSLAFYVSTFENIIVGLNCKRAPQSEIMCSGMITHTQTMNVWNPITLFLLPDTQGLTWDFVVSRAYWYHPGG